MDKVYSVLDVQCNSQNLSRYQYENITHTRKGKSCIMSIWKVHVLKYFMRYTTSSGIYGKECNIYSQVG